MHTTHINTTRNTIANAVSGFTPRYACSHPNLPRHCSCIIVIKVDDDFSALQHTDEHRQTHTDTWTHIRTNTQTYTHHSLHPQSKTHPLRVPAAAAAATAAATAVRSQISTFGKILKRTNATHTLKKMGPVGAEAVQKQKEQ